MKAFFERFPAPIRPFVVPGAFFLFALFVGPMFGSFWIKVLTQVAIMSIVCLGANILYGRVGLATLCQIGLMGVGAWASARLLFLTGWPLPVNWVLGALVTMVIGVVIGLPALRLGGLQLAMITLMAAGGLTVILNGLRFPNGGPGFKGLVTSVESRQTIGRPAGFVGDTPWFQLTVSVAALCFIVAHIHLGQRPGRAWAAIRQSEPAAIAAGIDITRFKLWAFALSSFFTGIAGGVYASSVGSPSPTTFQTPDSVILFATVIIGAVIIGGKFSLWGAVLAALLKEFLPQFLKVVLGFPDRLGIILFGLGVLLNLILTTRAARKKGISL